MTITFNYNNKVHQIKMDGTSYMPVTLVEGTSKEGKPIVTERVDGYFKNLGGAVKRIIDNEIGADESTVPLMDYVKRYEAAVKEIMGIIEEDEF